MEEKNDYYKSIDDLLRKVSDKNVYNFETSVQKDVKQFEADWSSNYSADFKDNLKIYKELLIEHLLEIRKDDAVNVFLAGFKNGVEFQEYLRNKYNAE